MQYYSSSHREVYIRSMRKHFFTLPVLLFFSIHCIAQDNEPNIQADSLTVAITLNNFLDTFKNLEFKKFKDYFANEVTVFFPPSAMVISRVEGKANVEKVLKTFFDKVRLQKNRLHILISTPNVFK